MKITWKLNTRGVTHPEMREFTTVPKRSDRYFRSGITTISGFSLIVLTLIGAFLAVRGYQIFKLEGFKFLTTYDWNVTTDETGKQVVKVGIGAMLIGTVLISFIALIIALPISISAALYLTYYAPTRMKSALVTAIDLMASFPSILYGLWGYFVLMPMAEYWAKLLHKYLGFLPFFKVPEPFYERSPFVAGLVLCVMLIPIITSVSREIYSQAPLDRIQAAYALGATKWAMIRSVVLPFGASGVVGAAMLALGRAFGETVAVFTVLNIVFKPNLDLLFGIGGNVASMIVLKWGEASPIETKALLASGFVLFVLTLLINVVADWVVDRAVKSGK